jgi:hypothetical protein
VHKVIEAAFAAAACYTLVAFFTTACSYLSHELNTMLCMLFCYCVIRDLQIDSSAFTLADAVLEHTRA